MFFVVKSGSEYNVNISKEIGQWATTEKNFVSFPLKSEKVEAKFQAMLVRK